MRSDADFSPTGTHPAGGLGTGRGAEPASDPPTVSVLIATRNRVNALRDALDSLFTHHNLEVPGWEVLIADNGSTDATVEVCREFAARFPGRLRWLVDSRQGKSNALNSGLLETRGEVIAMTDDDVLCAPNFLAEIRRVFSDRSIDSAQGRVFLDWKGGEPTWLDEIAEQLMSLRDYGDEMFEWEDRLSGCNMVVRRDAAIAVGGFAAELGPGTIGISEDSEFSRRLKDEGFRAVYAPSVVVVHQVPAGRVTPRFLRARRFGMGRSHAYYMDLKRPVWRFGLYALKDSIVAEFEASRLRRGGEPADAIRRQCESRERLGFFWQHLLFLLGVRDRKLTYLDPGSARAAESVGD